VDGARWVGLCRSKNLEEDVGTNGQ
jgi:hypothetical protein